jgi:hypothetical protein
VRARVFVHGILGAQHMRFLGATLFFTCINGHTWALSAHSRAHCALYVDPAAPEPSRALR